MKSLFGLALLAAILLALWCVRLITGGGYETPPRIPAI
jgi:hypothetical protein